MTDSLNLPVHPRFELPAMQSPLYRMFRLEQELRALGQRPPRLWVKRDDLLGLAGGGNKARKLEWLLGDAIGHGATHLLTVGGVQSNHARHTAASGNLAGLPVTLVLAQGALTDPEFTHSGNALLDELLGARIVRLRPGQQPQEIMAAESAQLAAQGQVPYEIPLGGSNVVGAFGYVQCAQEILDAQLENLTHVVLATGSGGTQAGLIAGFQAFMVADQPVQVQGMCVYTDAHTQRMAVSSLLQQLSKGESNYDEVWVDDQFLGPGYGIPTTAMRQALTLMAHTEGLVLDPVYTGKAMAGLLAQIAVGAYEPDSDVVFLHTGGLPGVFAYRQVLSGSGTRVGSSGFFGGLFG